MKIYRCSLEVRGYELDSFGHVNHSIYLNYLEHARWKLLEDEEITLAKFVAWKRWPVIANVEVSYLKPTFIGETLEVNTVIVDHSKAYLIFEQTILRAGAPVLKAKVRCVTVNELGRPAEMPQELAKLCVSSSDKMEKT